MARVMKARYFKHSDFMTAGLGSKPSFIWRSILWGRQVLQKGSRWRIGSGQKVQVYSSNWIPRPSTFRPVSAPKLRVDSVVADLIDKDHLWKEVVIKEAFKPADAEAILQIPLPIRPSEDQLIWIYDKRGQYSVKSGYQIAVRMKFPELPSCSSQNLNHWNTIWKLDIPEKLKIFLWRASNDLLPTAENLWKKKVVQEPLCQICCNSVETIAHALSGCKLAKKVWNLFKAEGCIPNCQFHDIISLIEDMTKQQTNVEKESVAALLWVIWNARNKWIFEGKQEAPAILVARAESVVESFKTVSQYDGSRPNQKREGKDIQEHSIPNGWLKVNVDAAANVEKQVAGLGVVITDGNQNCISAAINTSRYFGNMAMAEAAAVKWGLQVALRVGGTSVLIESDCLEVVELINNRVSSMAEIFWVISEILEIKKSFQNFKAQHTHRSCNGI